ncbi:protein CASPARIAN STRIP INTEGRITY FACTOR 2-like [Primulina huaijiensis]|uniref:protein CASPARIAN STRIP INTEGRITY FACTOR 2-like n=1 Tax=Primulina huaijiensis TaxID=1492673 RepID=UPI003CC73638
MGLILLVKNIILVLFLISSTSIPGLPSSSLESMEEKKSWEPHSHEKANDAHERLLLNVSTNDYGTYDPPPAFVKPPFKLIPN